MTQNLKLNVRISKYKNTFAEGYTPNWSEEILAIKKINDLNGEEITKTLYENELQRTNQEEFTIKIVIKKKVINHMLNGTDMIIHLIVGLIKTT